MAEQREALLNDGDDSSVEDGLDIYFEDIRKLEEAALAGKIACGGKRVRDWRDVEAYREMRELRRQLDDDYWFD
jgi:hypothetical protein